MIRSRVSTGELLASEIEFELLEAVGLAAEEGLAHLRQISHMQVDDEAEGGRGVDLDGVDALATLMLRSASTAQASASDFSRKVREAC